MLYAHKFFKTKEDAKAFQKKHGGAFYSNAPGSRTKRDYLTEAAMAEMTEKQREERPFCVAWNIVDDGPIKPEEMEDECK